MNTEAIQKTSTYLEEAPRAQDISCDGQAFAPITNMAIDSWMAESAPLDSNQPILRIYRWSPAGISIGRNQSWNRAIDSSALAENEVAVRRVTGGRAIYHDSSELTYSFVAPLSEGTKQADLASKIVQSLLEFLQGAGLDAQVERRVGYVPAHRSDRQSPHCFVSAARHEISVSGVKVIASAQRVHSGRFFQHGSIKLAGALSHPALYSRPQKQSETDGTKFDSNRFSTLEEDTFESAAESAAESIGLLEPDALRGAFSSVFGQGLMRLSLTSEQLEEVFSQSVDKDYIVGAFESSRHISSSHGHSHSDRAERTQVFQFPHIPHPVNHHPNPHFDPRKESEESSAGN